MHVASYPNGTTLSYASNASTAVLDLPTGSTILHAELVWAGSYGFDPSISGSVLNTPVTMITPDLVSHTITPNPATAQSRVNSGSNEFYVRSADVTSLITGAGTYTVGGVPATVVATENNLNCAGWTLAVAYSNPNMLTSSITLCLLFVGCEASGAAPAVVTGIHAPDNGTISSRLFVSCLEGDAQLAGDHFLVGPTSTLSSPTNALSGTNNPIDNFFCSQINTLLPLTTDVTTGKLIASGSSQLDTRGSFGTSNSISSTATSISGARQGYDITSVDMGSKIANSQTQLYVQGTTDQDVYTVDCLGIQIQVNAPVSQATKSSNASTAVLGDTITFTMTFTNNDQANASTLIFTDVIPDGLTYTPGTFTVNGTPVANPDFVNGIDIGDLAINATTTVIFEGVLRSCKFLNKTTYRLHAKWKRSESSGLKEYRIYKHGHCVATIKERKKLDFFKCHQSKDSVDEYKIAAINEGKAESKRVKIRIEYE